MFGPEDASAFGFESRLLCQVERTPTSRDKLRGLVELRCPNAGVHRERVWRRGRLWLRIADALGGVGSVVDGRRVHFGITSPLCRSTKSVSSASSGIGVSRWKHLRMRS